MGTREWEKHCSARFEDLGSKQCGSVTYCHTLVRPGYYPFCLGSPIKLAERRLQSWCRNAALWQRMDAHLDGSPWPPACPHPLCDKSFADGQDLWVHLIDEHGIESRGAQSHEESGI